MIGKGSHVGVMGDSVEQTLEAGVMKKTSQKATQQPGNRRRTRVWKPSVEIISRSPMHDSVCRNTVTGDR